MAAAALAAGCTVFAERPTADPNAGGGRVGGAEQLAQPQNPPGGEERFPAQDAGGGRADPSEFSGTDGQIPALPAFPAFDLQALRPGESLTRGGITFTLTSAALDAGGASIEWQVSGLPGGYTPAEQEPVIAIQLADGRLIQAIGARGSVQGGGAGAVETAQVSFAALPAGTRAFTLLLPNAWTGASETWRVPVVME